jgi:membrane protein implicated in regulation of membrane protease activity
VLFTVLAVTGLLLLLVSVLFDGLLDIFDLDSPFLSGTALAAFLSGFGFTGMLIPESWGTAGVLAAAAVAGLALAAGAGLGIKAMKNTQTDANVSASNVVGSIGTVTSPILVGQYGEVSVTVVGHRMKYNALADEAIARGTSVMVTEQLSGSSVRVSALPA